MGEFSQLVFKKKWAKACHIIEWKQIWSYHRTSFNKLPNYKGKPKFFYFPLWPLAKFGGCCLVFSCAWSPTHLLHKFERKNIDTKLESFTCTKHFLNNATKSNIFFFFVPQTFTKWFQVYCNHAHTCVEPFKNPFRLDGIGFWFLSWILIFKCTYWLK